uniref:Uncharacterized protein n=1 Tax=Rhabditophanes sp. KR3021 TaxID=114890 RepID=A0AC35TLK4_9BILA
MDKLEGAFASLVATSHTNEDVLSPMDRYKEISLDDLCEEKNAGPSVSPNTPFLIIMPLLPKSAINNRSNILCYIENAFATSITFHRRISVDVKNILYECLKMRNIDYIENQLETMEDTEKSYSTKTLNTDQLVRIANRNAVSVH